MASEKPKKNDPGVGTEYEVYVAAYFALQLNANPEIDDFKLESNVAGFGNLDDLLVDVKTKSGENLYFAFQLKHKEKLSNLSPTSFEVKNKRSNNFSLEKYCEAFKKLNEENKKKYHFILYTNNNFDRFRTNKVNKFNMKHDWDSLGRNFFDTSGDYRNHLFKFEVNEQTEDEANVKKDDYRQFFSQFSIYTAQSNFRDLEKSIMGILKYKECYVRYVDFMRRWHRGDFIDKILDKKTLTIHLFDMFSSSFATNYQFSNGRDVNSNFFEAMVQQFDVTIVDASIEEFIKQLKDIRVKYERIYNINSQQRMIQLGKESKFIDRFTVGLNDETKYKLQHYFFKKPLILDFNKDSKDQIYDATKLSKLQEIGIKLVIMGKDIEVSTFSHLKIFRNLTAVHGYFLEETKKRCRLFLQGRDISFGEIFEDEIREFVTPREIFLMLKGSFSIGGDKERVPECFIPRSVSTKVFDIKSIIKHSSGSAVLIFNCEDKLEEVKTLIQKIIDCEDFLPEYLPGAIMLRTKECSKRELEDLPTIILRKEECPREQLDEILKKLRQEHSKKGILRQKTYSNDRLDKEEEESEEMDIHSFKVIDEKRCFLLMSTKNISYNRKYKCTKIYVEENNIPVFFNNSINILCAQPGMGKSTLMKYLKNEYDPNFWTLRVDLKAHNQFLIKNQKIENVLKYFLQIENCQDPFLLSLKGMFLRKKKIVLFLDGLDEVENECVDCVLNITRELSEMGFRIWLSSRQNLKQKIEHYFNIPVIQINELSENQQKEYLENSLKSLFNKKEIEEIVEIIFNNTDLVNNRQILEIPLQLQIITQIFIDDKSHYSNLTKNNFILTKMFEIFFQGRYKHYLSKIGLKHPHLLGDLEERLENYELVALHSVLDDEHFQKLQIEKLKATEIRKSDFLGIITEINKENKAVFEHLTYAEYFASKFFVKNFDKARLLKEEIFGEKYQNLLLMFNIMLAEDSPLHIAVIYKDLRRIEELEQSTSVDKGGRNFLQVAASLATRHPFLECSRRGWGTRHKSCLECKVRDKSVEQFQGEDLKIKEIVNRTFLSEPFKKDTIFEWNSLDYALAAGALYIVEAILSKCEKPSNFYEILGKHYRDEVLAYYSIRFGYHRLLSEIIAKNSCRVSEIVSDFLFIHPGTSSILHFLFTSSDYTNRIRIVELLTGDDINKIVYDAAELTFLHFATMHEDTEFLKYLLERKADVNVQDEDGRTPLFQAVMQQNFEIAKLLIEKGADANIKNKDDWSPLFWAVRPGNFEISKLLFENGADVNLKVRDDEEETSPLMWAINRNKHEIAKLLVEKGDVDMKDKTGKTLLLMAVIQNNFEISKLLVEKGADVNVEDKFNERAPLLYAVMSRNYEISKLLVENGAQVNIKDKWFGKSPLFWAYKHNNSELKKLLEENGAVDDIDDREITDPFYPYFRMSAENPSCQQ